MSKKALRRKEFAEDSIEDATEVPEGPSAVTVAARSALSFLTTHLWKAAGVAVAVMLAIAFASGLVNVGSLSSGISQYATSRTDQAPAPQAVIEASGAQAELVPEAAPTATSMPATVATSTEQSLTPCFAPTENCTAKVVAAINGAKSEILVQAYSLTTATIIDALANARRRGVNVRVILDKADERDHNSGGARLIANRILPYVDAGVAIAHSKIIVIDKETVITSSFNFEKAAQKANTEDLLVIQGHPNVAAAYRDNWHRRLAASRPYYGTMAPVL